MGGLLDLITGGEDEQAQNDLSQALQNVEAVQTPTAEQLQLSPLAQYESTGNISPALANAATAGPSAYDSENISQVPISDMQSALSQEQAIANAQGMTPQEQASIAEAEQSANEAEQGQRGSIAQSFAAEGVPQSLISAALQNGTEGQEAQQMYQNALTAQGQAANQGITALQNEGSLASTLYGQEAGQANTVAAAQNALNQFNAANTQQTSLANQANTQAANTYNTTNAQTIANQNVQGEQTVQEQNQVEAPQEAASLALQKAGDEAQVGNNQAQQQTAVGQQSAGLFSGILGAGATLGAGAIAAAEGGEIPKPKVPPTAFLRGGQVPGQARVAGDSPANDLIPAKLSPGEYVLPRTVAQNPGVRNFLARVNPQKPPAGAHPSDIASILRALGQLRQGA
jgi:hypothetical protein